MRDMGTRHLPRNRSSFAVSLALAIASGDVLAAATA